MATLPTIAPPDPTLEVIDAHIVARQHSEPKRGYLGMSFIGEECERRQWYSFRFVSESNFDAPTLRRFEDGHRGEDLMAGRLRMVKQIKLYTVNPQDGRQFGFHALGGHFRGNIDGALQGLLQAPKAWHVWEHKVSEKASSLLGRKAMEITLLKVRASESASALAKLKSTLGEKSALEKWNATYYAQAICYMHYSGMDRHYLTCDTPGGRATVSVRTEADKGKAEALEAKAERIIFSPEPLTKISEDAAFWKCKGCPSAQNCHGSRIPVVSCRTCVHATPERDGDGRWSCARHKTDLTLAAQQAACTDHLFIPALVTWGALEDASEAENWISYKTPDGFAFRNGARGVGSYSSTELAAIPLAALRSDEMQAIRSAWLPDAQWVGVESEWKLDEVA